MIVVWTIVFAIVCVVWNMALMSLVGLLLMMPLVEIGRRVKVLKIPMWFLARYGFFALDVIVTIYATLYVTEHFMVEGVVLYVINGLLLLSAFNNLYRFDMLMYETQSGVWASSVIPEATVL